MANNATISFKVEGIEHLKASLSRYKGAMPKAMRKGVTAGSRRVAKAGKANLGTVRQRKLRELTGILRESMGFKIKNYGEGNVIGVIGPRVGFRRQVGVRKRDGKKSKAGDPIYHDPAKIAHLVEFGHGGPHPAPPHPFMRPAYETSKAGVMADIRDALEAGLVKELR